MAPDSATDRSDPKARSWFSAQALAVAWSIAALIGLVIALRALQIDRTPTMEAGRDNLASLRPFWITSALLWLGLTTLVRTLKQRDHSPHSLRSTAFILLVAVLARGIVVWTHTPALSDDVSRYVFDGRNVTHGVNPYVVLPAERDELLRRGGDEAWPGERWIVGGINNPEMYTIYLPTGQIVFAGASLLAGRDASDTHASVRGQRGVMALIDLGAIVLLLIAVRRAGRSVWWVALYAWHPLVISEIAGSGHQDAIGVALLLATLVLWDARRPAWLWTIPLALATLVKPVVLPIAPLLLRGRSWKTWVVSAATGSVVCAALAGPFLLTHDGQPLDNLRATAQRFSLKWAHFGSVYEPLLWTIERATNDPAEAWQRPDADLWTNDDQERLARVICALLVLVVIMVTFFRVDDAWARARIVLFAMLLLSSTAHPWYLLWSLALLPRAFSPALWVASLTLPWGYWQLGDVVEWHTPWWVYVLSYAPVYGVLGWEMLMGDRWRS